MRGVGELHSRLGAPLGHRAGIAPSAAPSTAGTAETNPFD